MLQRIKAVLQFHFSILETDGKERLKDINGFKEDKDAFKTVKKNNLGPKKGLLFNKLWLNILPEL